MNFYFANWFFFWLIVFQALFGGLAAELTDIREAEIEITSNKEILIQLPKIITWSLYPDYKPFEARSSKKTFLQEQTISIFKQYKLIQM